jgi:anti-sigma-K factor RskA
MKLASDRRLDALCGEYLLGTLRGGARRRFERALREEPQVALRLRYWQGVFAPRYATMIETRPDPGGFKRLYRELGLQRYRTPWYRRAGFWRGWAMAATAVLVVGIGFQVLRPLLVGEPPSRPLTALRDQAGTTAVGVIVIPRDHILVLSAARPVTASPQQSYELWLLPADGRAPISLAVLGSLDARVQVSDDNAKLVRPGAKLAVSVEPAGGSPTGAPTGPVILVGDIT